MSGSSGGHGRGHGLPAQSLTRAKPQPPPKVKYKSQLQSLADSTAQPPLRTSIPRAVNKDKIGTPAQIIFDNMQKKRTPAQKKADERQSQLQAAAADQITREKEAERLSILASEEDRLHQEDIGYEAQGIYPDLHTALGEEDRTYLTSTEEFLLP